MPHPPRKPAPRLLKRVESAAYALLWFSDGLGRLPPEAPLPPPLAADYAEVLALARRTLSRASAVATLPAPDPARPPTRAEASAAVRVAHAALHRYSGKPPL